MSQEHWCKPEKLSRGYVYCDWIKPFISLTLKCLVVTKRSHILKQTCSNLVITKNSINCCKHNYSINSNEIRTQGTWDGMGFRQRKIESNTVFKVLEIRLCIVKKVISISNLLWYKNYYIQSLFHIRLLSNSFKK